MFRSGTSIFQDFFESTYLVMFVLALLFLRGKRCKSYQDTVGYHYADVIG